MTIPPLPRLLYIGNEAHHSNVHHIIIHILTQTNNMGYGMVTTLITRETEIKPGHKQVPGHKKDRDRNSANLDSRPVL